MNPSIDIFKTSLINSRARWFCNGKSHLSPFQRVLSYTNDVDKLLVEIFTSFIFSKNGNIPLCLIALGGYGRGELCPYSDIDLLILHNAPSMPAEIASTIRFFWDIGLTMGCVVRNVEECAAILGEDISTDIAFLENRFLMGDAALHRRLMNNAVLPYFSKKKNHFIGRLWRILQDKLYSPENTLYHVEPDLKNGDCTLRDCHRLLWIERLRTGIRSIKELHNRSGFSTEQIKQFFADYEFLLKLRSQLHCVCGRRMDILEIALQPEIARRCGFSTGGAGALMERFFKTVRSLRLFLLTYLEKGPPGSDLWTCFRRRIGAMDAAPGIRMCEGIFFIAGKNTDRRMNPVWILTIFRQAVRCQATLSVELRNAIRKAAAVLPVDDFKSQRVNDLLREILSFNGNIGHIMQLLHETNILSRIIPQFEDITCKVEYDSYHEFTVDQHLLTTLTAADNLSRKRDGAIATIYSKCASKMLLRLALLLHDIGKALPGDHVVNGAIIAETICEHLGLDEDDVRRVRTLIYLHLDMAELSLHRGPGSTPLVEFARRIGDRKNLDMLYLLTILDIRSVGHATWTAWKAYQLEHFYNDLIGIFKGRLHEPASPAIGAKEADDTYQWDVLPEDRQRYQEWLQMLVPGGLLIHGDDFHGFERLTVCGWDRMGFLRDIIGCISSEGCNVLGAHLYSMHGGKVLDIFYVEPPFSPAISSARRIQNMLKKWRNITHGCTDADSLVADRIKKYPLKKLRNARQIKPRIAVDAISSNAATVLKIKTADNFGILHKIVQCLNRNSINIRSAHLSTRGDLANDVFYITDAGNGKIDAVKLHMVSREIAKALSQ